METISWKIDLKSLKIRWKTELGTSFNKLTLQLPARNRWASFACLDWCKLTCTVNNINSKLKATTLKLAYILLRVTLFLPIPSTNIQFLHPVSKFISKFVAKFILEFIPPRGTSGKFHDATTPALQLNCHQDRRSLDTKYAEFLYCKFRLGSGSRSHHARIE